jgi:mono/diheme cytochrome c family protein
VRLGYAILALALAACASEKLPDASLTFSREGALVKKLSVEEMAKVTPVVDIDIDDPQYGRQKHYKGVALAPIVKAAYGEVDAKQQFVIRATDGYAIPTTGETLTTDGAYLAFRDREAPNWDPIGPQKVSPGPFYMVWRGAEHTDANVYPWPYAMQQIDAVTLETLYAKASPGDGASTAVKHGFELVLHRCIKCHAVNGQGGHLGPELNIPKNVTEYWPADLIKSYIKDPSALRYGNMPPNPDLSDKDIEDIYAYLSTMKDHKAK